MSEAPVIETERLRLRAHRRSDYPACKALWQHPETARFIGGGGVQDDQAVWFRLLRYGGMWPLLGFGFWVFEDKTNLAYLGEGGLLDAVRGIPFLEHMPEAGWAVMPEAAGKGIATEAMRAILAWTDANLHVTRAGCVIDPGNAPSLRVAAKLGFEEVDRSALNGEPVILLHRERPQAAILPESA